MAHCIDCGEYLDVQEEPHKYCAFCGDFVLCMDCSGTGDECPECGMPLTSSLPDASEYRCRECGREWESSDPDGLYFVSNDLCAHCAGVELGQFLSGWKDLIAEIGKTEK